MLRTAVILGTSVDPSFGGVGLYLRLTNWRRQPQARHPAARHRRSAIVIVIVFVRLA
jgi:hypothetical protein